MSDDCLDWLNELPAADAERELLACCGAPAWARAMAAARPFPDREALLARADEIWWSLDEADWLQAFRAHPRIGEREAESSAGERAAQWSEREQAGVADAAAAVRAELARGNIVYEKRFGHIFLIRASGRTVEDMLAEQRARLEHDADTELRVAAEQQRQITRLRLERLLEP